jgi:hypothetical protein
MCTSLAKSKNKTVLMSDKEKVSFWKGKNPEIAASVLVFQRFTK